MRAVAAIPFTVSKTGTASPFNGINVRALQQTHLCQRSGRRAAVTFRCGYWGIWVLSTTSRVLLPRRNHHPNRRQHQVTEGGATDTYTVVLNSAPTGDVTITLNSGTQLSTNVPTLTFTAGNWNVAQTVTVTAVNDTVGEGPHQGRNYQHRKQYRQ
jgi:hypothetical protein